MEKKTRKKSEVVNKTYIATGIFITLFILSLVGTLIFFNMRKPKYIQLPNFVGMTVTQAEKEAKKIGIELEIENNGGTTITSQEPRFLEDYEIRKGTTIKVIIGDE